MRSVWQKSLLMSVLLVIIAELPSSLLAKDSTPRILADNTPQKTPSKTPPKDVETPKSNQIVVGGIKIRWTPPNNVGTSGRRQAAGGSRGSCSDLLGSQQNEKGTLTALVPTVIEGRTNSEQPTFFVYLPYQSKQKYSYEFLLINQDEKDIYKVKSPITPNQGIIGITLPETVYLERGQTYYWTFSFIFENANTPCNPSKIPITDTVEGAVSLDKRPPNDTLLKQLKTATIEEQITIYTEQGWWYNALASLAQLRYKYPDNPEILSAWRELLETQNLGELATEKILPY